MYKHDEIRMYNTKERNVHVTCKMYLSFGQCQPLKAIEIMHHYLSQNVLAGCRRTVSMYRLQLSVL